MFKATSHSLIRKIRVWLIVSAIGIILYQIALMPETISYILRSSLPADARLELKIERSSLLFGFQFRDVRLTDAVSGDHIFQADLVNLNWFLPGFAIGQIGIRQIGLKNPTVSIIKRNNRWNTEVFGSTEEIKKEPRKNTSSPMPESIELFLPLRLYGAFQIEGLHFVIEDSSEADPLKFDVSDIDLYASFVTKTFHSIPLNTDALQMFDSFFIAVNPVRPVKLEYAKLHSIHGSVNAMLKLYTERLDTGTTFLSRLNIDSHKLMYNHNLVQIPFELTLKYDIRYDTTFDKLKVNQVELNYGPDTWLSLIGEFKQDNVGFHYADLKIEKSLINLDRINPLLMQLTNYKLETHGTVSLLPLSIEGRLDQLLTDLGIQANQVQFRLDSSNHYVPTANIQIHADIDSYALGLVQPPEAYIQDKSLAYGLIREANVSQLSAGYNGAFLQAKATLKPDEGLNADVDLRSFNLGQFTSPYLTGLGSALLKAKSTTDFNRITLAGLVQLNSARYLIDRSISGFHNLALNTDLDLVFPDSGMSIEIRTANITGSNFSGQKLTHLMANGMLTFAHQTQSYRVNLHKLDLDFSQIQPLLPGNLRSTLAFAQTYLMGGVHLNGNANLQFDSDNGLIQSDLSLILPSISADALSLSVDMATSLNEIHFRRTQLHGLRGALQATLTGGLLGVNHEPNLDFRFNLSRQGMLPVHENIAIDGSIDIRALIQPTLVSGAIDIRKFNLIFQNTACITNETGCTRYYVEDLNFNLPFVHNLKFTPVQYNELINPDLLQRFQDTPNLTLKSIWSNRSPDGLAVDQGFYYLGSPIVNTRPAIEASLQYQRNVFESRLLRVSTYHELKPKENSTKPIFSNDQRRYISNGSIEIQNLFFNLGNLNPVTMEYGAHISVHDLNVEPYFPKADSSYDGIISAVANLRGTNLNDAVRNLKARLAVYRISKDFTGLAVRIMVPSDIIARVVNNTLEIPSMSAELRSGLVYTTIQIRSPGMFTLSKLIKPGDQMIRQERIPLAEFLERTKKETGEFQ
ncbi:MAG: hypothetical protein H3C43_09165 [Leptonema sp. (in: Bacteria)]|nr:hypothetical protein [Leptonema sp. (in: bacteria)]